MQPRVYRVGGEDGVTVDPVPGSDIRAAMDALAQAERDPIYLDWRRRKGIPRTRPGVPFGYRTDTLLSPTSVEDVLGLAAFLALRISLRWTPTPEQLAFFPEVPGAYLPALFGAAVLRAVPCLWTDDVLAPAMSMRSSLPSHTVGPAMWPTPDMLWLFGAPVGDLDAPERLRVAGMLLLPYGPGPDGHLVSVITVTTPGETGVSEWRIDLLPLPYGWHWPEDFPPEGRRKVDLWLALSSFLNSPYIPKEERTLSGRYRRTMLREGSHRVDQAVRFVDLRPTAPAAADEGPADGGDGHRYHVRWLVRGHTRAQWYPKERSHRLVWIAPHLKGPEDAPLKQSVYRVVR